MFRIVLVRIGLGKSVEVIIEGRRESRAARGECILQEDLAVCIAVEGFDQGSTYARICQRFTFLHGKTGKNVADGIDFRGGEFALILEECKIARRNVDGNVDFALLESHGACRRVIDCIDDSMLVRNSCIVIRVRIKLCLGFGEALYDIRTSGNRALLVEVLLSFSRRVDDDEERIAQHAWKCCNRLLGVNRDSLSISCDMVEWEHSLGTRRFSKRSLDGFLDSFTGDRIAVGEFDILDLECPGHLVRSDQPAFSDPGFRAHFIIKVDECFADTVTHDLPAEIVGRRFKAVGEVRYADTEGVFTRGGRTSAASGKTKNEKGAGCKGSPFLCK